MKYTLTTNSKDSKADQPWCYRYLDLFFRLTATVKGVGVGMGKREEEGRVRTRQECNSIGFRDGQTLSLIRHLFPGPRCFGEN